MKKILSIIEYRKVYFLEVKVLICPRLCLFLSLIQSLLLSSYLVIHQPIYLSGYGWKAAILLN